MTKRRNTAPGFTTPDPFFLILKNLKDILKSYDELITNYRRNKKNALSLKSAQSAVTTNRPKSKEFLIL